jgi:serine phosphatase RsbU (regulator of sigma subunit)
VGGDFYDVVPTDDGAAIVVGDACGKGTKAASFMGIARWTLRSTCFGRWTPAKALARLNHVLINAHETRSYATLALASIRPIESGGADLTLALAGHPQPLVIRGDGTIEPVGVTSSVVGWRPGVAFVESPVRLGSGESMVLFTDGVLEALCGHASSDQTRLEHVLGALAGTTAEETADALDSAIIDGDLERDDAAFLVVRAR